MQDFAYGTSNLFSSGFCFGRVEFQVLTVIDLIICQFYVSTVM